MGRDASARNSSSTRRAVQQPPGQLFKLSWVHAINSIVPRTARAMVGSVAAFPPGSSAKTRAGRVSVLRESPTDVSKWLPRPLRFSLDCRTPMSRYAARRDKLRRSFRKTGIDALLVTNFTNVTYLTGFSGDDSYLLVHGQGRSRRQRPALHDATRAGVPGAGVVDSSAGGGHGRARGRHCRPAAGVRQAGRSRRAR